MTNVFIRRGEFECKDTCADGEGHVKMEAEFGEMQIQAEEHQRLKGKR